MRKVDLKTLAFPFLFGRVFIEARRWCGWVVVCGLFSFLFVGTFIKASRRAHPGLRRKHLNLPYSFCRDFP